MKKLLIIGLCLLGIGAQAQTELPDDLLVTIEDKYPDGIILSQDMVDDEYIIEVEDVYEESILVKFDLNGNWIDSSTSLEEHEIPEEIIVAISSKVKGARIITADYVETNSSSLYRFLVRSSKKEVFLIDADILGEILSLTKYTKNS